MSITSKRAVLFEAVHHYANVASQVDAGEAEVRSRATAIDVAFLEVEDALETLSLTVLEKVDNGNALSLCAEYCQHQDSYDKDCPLVLLENLRQHIRGES